MIEFVVDTDHPVVIPVGDLGLNGLLHLPLQARGVIIFAHGSGSSHLSPRNQYIAREMQQLRFATLLFDLLTEDEDSIDTKTREFRFDIDLLAERLITATLWIADNAALHKLPIGYFGASTGGAAALVAAANLHNKVKAVVSRGGRPDLAEYALQMVRAPTLLIVGGDDKEVIALNQKALANLSCVKRLDIVAHATHLFEEPGKLEEVAKLAGAWFVEFNQ